MKVPWRETKGLVATYQDFQAHIVSSKLHHHACLPQQHTRPALPNRALNLPRLPHHRFLLHLGLRLTCPQ